MVREATDACGVCMPFWTNRCISDRTADTLLTRPDKDDTKLLLVGAAT